MSVRVPEPRMSRSEGERERGREGEREREGEGESGRGDRGRSEKARISTCYAFKTCLLLALNFSIVKNLPLRREGVGAVVMTFDR